jgi:hypothetical protein
MLARRRTPGVHPAPIPRTQARDGGVFIDVITQPEGMRDVNETGTHRVRGHHDARRLVTEYENDCKPDCAQGHIHYYPALVVLWGSGSVPGHPAERRYTEVTLIYRGHARRCTSS